MCARARVQEDEITPEYSASISFRSYERTLQSMRFIYAHKAVITLLQNESSLTVFFCDHEHSYLIACWSIESSPLFICRSSISINDSLIMLLMVNQNIFGYLETLHMSVDAVKHSL